MMSIATITIDVRAITPRERHALIVTRFDALQPGQSLLLVNDHDPLPLQAQLELEGALRFSWDYLEAGPEVWRVQIGKGAGAKRAAGSCCSGGACGG